MVKFHCAHCDKKFEFKMLPIPDIGAKFQCDECGKKCLLIIKHNSVFCLRDEDSEIESGSRELLSSYDSQREEDFTEQELESRLQGCYPDLPYEYNFVFGVTEGPEQGTLFPIKKPSIIIGKTGCDINLSDSKVSREHCSVEIFGNQMTVVRDLRSAGGTCHNGLKVNTALLKPGDYLEIGESKLVFIKNAKKLGS